MEHASELAVLERLRTASKTDSDKDLALLLGLSRQSVAKARATKSVPASWIPLAARLFNVSTDWLFFGSLPMHPGEAPQTPELQANAPETPPEAAGVCPRCAKLEAELEMERAERRELSAENRQLWKENAVLREEVATLRERQKTCCPDPIFKTTQAIPSNNEELQA